MNWLKAKAWMLGTVCTAALALTLGVKLVGAQHEVSTLTRSLNAKEKAISDPATGYIVRLDRCHANGLALEGKLADQSTKVADLGRKSAEKLAAADVALSAAAKERDKAIASLAALSKPLVAFDSCARVYEMDQRFMESLK